MPEPDEFADIEPGWVRGTALAVCCTLALAELVPAPMFAVAPVEPVPLASTGSPFVPGSWPVAPLLTFTDATELPLLERAPLATPLPL